MTNNPELLFFDDFTTPGLNRQVWNVEVTGKVHNHEQQAYIDSSDTVYLTQTEPEANGALILQAHYRPGFCTPQGAQFDFVSGRIDTRDKYTFRYGRVSARLKMPVEAGSWPAFWVLGVSGAWPACGEIDIMEAVGEADWISAAVHGRGYSGEAALVNKAYFQPPHSAADWHIYAADCTPDGLFFFVDEVLIYRVTRPMVEFFGRWAFDTEKFLILNLGLGGTYPFKTNAVRQPYYGLPADTVRSMQNKPLRFVIDWVKITAF
jgi:beta-glucanase (GH16 family)